MFTIATAWVIWIDLANTILDQEHMLTEVLNHQPKIANTTAASSQKET